MSYVDPTAGPRPKVPFRWGYFLFLNVLSASIAFGIFVFVLYADFLDGGAGKTVSFFVGNPALMATAAAAPLITTLLIGFGYARRGAKKKKFLEARRQAALAVQAQATPPLHVNHAE